MSYPVALRNRLITVDVETGGLDAYTASLLQVGMVGPDGEELNILIREPQIEASDEALAINKIDLEDVHEHGLAPAEAVVEIRRFLWPILQRQPMINGKRRRLIFCAHNAHFDWAFLARLGHLALEPGFMRAFFSHRLIDSHTLMVALSVLGELAPDRIGSPQAWADLGAEIPPEDLHTAIGDARGCRRLILNAIGRLDERRCPSAAGGAARPGGRGEI